MQNRTKNLPPKIWCAFHDWYLLEAPIILLLGFLFYWTPELEPSKSPQTPILHDTYPN